MGRPDQTQLRGLIYKRILEGQLGPGNPYSNMGQHTCYKVIVDWILTTLFPHIKHVPNVLLTGAINASVVNKWDYILNKEYNERNSDERTYGYDRSKTCCKLRVLTRVYSPRNAPAL
jgi:hypothetical protein